MSNINMGEMAFSKNYDNYYQLGKRKRPEESNSPSCTKRNGVAIGQCIISAHASSVRKDNYDNWGPQLAWSGHSNENVGFFSSKPEMKPWLKLRLKPVQISSVTIINRKDCNGDILRNIEVCAGMSPDLTDNVVGRFQGPGVTGAEHVIQFNRTIMVEFIVFQMMERGILHVNGIKINEISASELGHTDMSEAECNQTVTSEAECNRSYAPLGPGSGGLGPLVDPRDPLGLNKNGLPVPRHSYKTLLNLDFSNDLLDLHRKLICECLCGKPALEQCAQKSCGAICCNDPTCEMHGKLVTNVRYKCLCGNSASNQCAQKSCAICCDRSTCHKHGKRPRCSCGTVATNNCSNNSCTKCCNHATCQKHKNNGMCNCGKTLTKLAKKHCKLCVSCCNDQAHCRAHRERCDCGSTLSKDCLSCLSKNCKKCCKNSLCYHNMHTQQNCSCGGIARKGCTKNSCVQCCDDDSCPTHRIICHYAKCAKVASKKCSKKRCSYCCNDDSCKAHVSLCSCGKSATRNCSKKNCEECCKDFLCEKHWKKHVNSNIGDLGSIIVSQEKVVSGSLHQNIFTQAAPSDISQHSQENKSEQASCSHGSRLISRIIQQPPLVPASDSSQTPVSSSIADIHGTSLSDEREEGSEYMFYIKYPFTCTSGYFSRVYDEKYIRGLFEPFCTLKHVVRIDERSARVTLDDTATFDTYDCIYLNLVMKCDPESTDSVHIVPYSEYIEKKKSEVVAENNIMADVSSEVVEVGSTDTDDDDVNGWY